MCFGEFWVQTCSHRAGLYSHEAAHHLLGVLRAPGVSEADEGAVDRDPGAPLQLETRQRSKGFVENREAR